MTLLLAGAAIWVVFLASVLAAFLQREKSGFAQNYLLIISAGLAFWYFVLGIGLLASLLWFGVFSFWLPQRDMNLIERLFIYWDQFLFIMAMSPILFVLALLFPVSQRKL